MDRSNFIKLLLIKECKSVHTTSRWAGLPEVRNDVPAAPAMGTYIATHAAGARRERYNHRVFYPPNRTLAPPLCKKIECMWSLLPYISLCKACSMQVHLIMESKSYACPVVC